MIKLDKYNKKYKLTEKITILSNDNEEILRNKKSTFTINYENKTCAFYDIVENIESKEEPNNYFYEISKLNENNVFKVNNHNKLIEILSKEIFLNKFERELQNLIIKYSSNAKEIVNLLSYYKRTFSNGEVEQEALQKGFYSIFFSDIFNKSWYKLENSIKISRVLVDIIPLFETKADIFYEYEKEDENYFYINITSKLLNYIGAKKYLMELLELPKIEEFKASMFGNMIINKKDGSYKQLELYKLFQIDQKIRKNIIILEEL